MDKIFDMCSGFLHYSGNSKISIKENFLPYWKNGLYKRQFDMLNRSINEVEENLFAAKT